MYIRIEPISFKQKYGFVIAGVILCIIDWIIVSMIQLAEKIVGYTKSELLSKTIKSMCLKNKMDEKQPYYFIK